MRSETDRIDASDTIHVDKGKTFPSPKKASIRSLSFEVYLDSIFIRWISVSDALEYKQLNEIDFDCIPLEPNATIGDLKKRATDQFYPDGVECYLTNCYLSVTPGKSVAIKDLGLTEKPINIFLVPAHSNFKSEEQAAFWQFLEDNSESLNLLSEALLKATHFPPAVLALEKLLAKSPQDQPSNLKEQSVLLHCLLELAFCTMPHLREHENRTKDAISRFPCLIPWLKSEKLSEYKQVVRAVELRKKGAEKRLSAFSEVVPNIRLPLSTTEGYVETTASLQPEAAAHIRAHLLALALYPEFDEPYNYFLDNSHRTRDLLEGERVLPTFSYSPCRECDQKQSASATEAKSTIAKGKMKEADSNSQREIPQSQFKVCSL